MKRDHKITLDLSNKLLVLLYLSTCIAASTKSGKNETTTTTTTTAKPEVTLPEAESSLVETSVNLEGQETRSRSATHGYSGGGGGGKGYLKQESVYNSHPHEEQSYEYGKRIAGHYKGNAYQVQQEEIDHYPQAEYIKSQEPYVQHEVIDSYGHSNAKGGYQEHQGDSYGQAEYGKGTSSYINHQSGGVEKAPYVPYSYEVPKTQQYATDDHLDEYSGKSSYSSEKSKGYEGKGHDGGSYAQGGSKSYSSPIVHASQHDSYGSGGEDYASVGKVSHFPVFPKEAGYITGGAKEPEYLHESPKQLGYQEEAGYHSISGKGSDISGSPLTDSKKEKVAVFIKQIGHSKSGSHYGSSKTGERHGYLLLPVIPGKPDDKIKIETTGAYDGNAYKGIAQEGYSSGYEQKPTHDSKGKYSYTSFFKTGASALGEDHKSDLSTYGGDYKSNDQSYGGDYKLSGPSYGEDYKSSGPVHGEDYKSSGPAYGGEHKSSGISYGGDYKSSGPAYGGEHQSSGIAYGGDYKSSGQAYGGEHKSSGIAYGGEHKSSGIAYGGEHKSSGIAYGGDHKSSGIAYGGDYKSGGSAYGGEHKSSGTAYGGDHKSSGPAYGEDYKSSSLAYGDHKSSGIAYGGDYKSSGPAYGGDYKSGISVYGGNSKPVVSGYEINSKGSHDDGGHYNQKELSGYSGHKSSSIGEVGYGAVEGLKGHSSYESQYEGNKDAHTSPFAHIPRSHSQKSAGSYETGKSSGNHGSGYGIAVDNVKYIPAQEYKNEEVYGNHDITYGFAPASKGSTYGKEVSSHDQQSSYGPSYSSHKGSYESSQTYKTSSNYGKEQSAPVKGKHSQSHGYESQKSYGAGEISPLYISSSGKQSGSQGKRFPAPTYGTFTPMISPYGSVVDFSRGTSQYKKAAASSKGHDDSYKNVGAQQHGYESAKQGRSSYRKPKSFAVILQRQQGGGHFEDYESSSYPESGKGYSKPLSGGYSGHGFQPIIPKHSGGNIGGTSLFYNVQSSYSGSPSYSLIKHTKSASRKY
ncbi:uncharacterized protein TNCT_221121 [Trichonephila clavata]|uniref:Hornerin-like n=1 Tax=Trichonephila clavata TaxID=2740835 RepID=A0A8X6GF34_TRICU|nr:uncharacterized protein TNCT_221121 [Trichonephila clavata]